MSEGTLPEEMESAIATLEPGQVSEPVVTDSGVHLIKVTEVAEKRELPSLADLSDQIRADLKRARAEAMLNEDVAQLEELLYEHSDLAEPAQQVGAQVEQSDWVALSALPSPLNNPQVQQALNSDQVRKDGHNSDLIELGQGQYLAVRIAEEKPAEPMPLEEVAFSIRERLKGEKRQTRCRSFLPRPRRNWKRAQLWVRLPPCLVSRWKSRRDCNVVVPSLPWKWSTVLSVSLARRVTRGLR